MMKSPKNCQSESGMWNLLVDKTDCWLEASGSAMFAYAMIMEVKKVGWMLPSMVWWHGRYGNFFVKRSVFGE